MKEFIEIILITSFLSELLVGLLVYFKGKKKLVNRLFFLMMLSPALWSLMLFLAILFSSNILVKVSMVFGLFGSFFFYQFCRAFSQVEKKFKLNFILLLSVLSIIMAVLILFSNIITGDTIFHADGFLELTFGSQNYLFYIYHLVFTILGIYILFKGYKSSTGLRKLHFQYLFTGLGIILLFFIIINSIFPILGLYQFISISPLAFLILAFFFLYIISRYRLMDIKVVIRKGFVNFFSLAIVLFFYLYLLIVFQQFLAAQYGWSEQTLTIILVLFVVVTIEPLRRFLIKIVNKTFYSKQKSVHKEAEKLRVVLSSSMQFDQLVKKVKTELQDFLEVPEIQFVWFNKQTGKLENYYKEDKKVIFSLTDPVFQYLQTNPEILVTEEIPYLIEEQGNGEREVLQSVEKKLKALAVGLVMPIGEKGELVGAFFFSQKKKKEAFTSDNVEYLSRMQFPMTNAIANALLYKQAVERISKL